MLNEYYYYYNNCLVSSDVFYNKLLYYIKLNTSPNYDIFLIKLSEVLSKLDKYNIVCINIRYKYSNGTSDKSLIMYQFERQKKIERKSEDMKNENYY